jgi:hypothetical protein
MSNKMSGIAEYTAMRLQKIGDFAVARGRVLSPINT